MKKSLVKVAAGALALSIAQLSAGFEAGDWLLRAGVINVDPDSSPASLGAGLDIDVDDSTQLGLNAVYFVTDNIGVELLAATPFKHDVQLNGTDVGETKQLPPTVMAVWYPNSSDSAYQPYLGGGLNYTIFFEDKMDSGADLDIDDSFGLSVELGMDYKISDNLFVNGQVRYIDISTDASIGGGSKFDIDIDPMVYMISLGFKL